MTEARHLVFVAFLILLIQGCQADDKQILDHKQSKDMSININPPISRESRGVKVSAKVKPEEGVFFGRPTDTTHFDAEVFIEERQNCESRRLPQSTLFDIMANAKLATKSVAYQFLELTPCQFVGDINYKNQNARFLFYETGYLAIFYDATADDEYFICDEGCFGLIEEWFEDELRNEKDSFKSDP